MQNDASGRKNTAGALNPTSFSCCPRRTVSKIERIPAPPGVVWLSSCVIAGTRAYAAPERRCVKIVGTAVLQWRVNKRLHKKDRQVVIHFL